MVRGVSPVMPTTFFRLLRTASLIKWEIAFWTSFCVRKDVDWERRSSFAAAERELDER
jgi:hypothetical protein